jgi:tetratricopeptide (TPR) repeat protein
LELRGRELAEALEENHQSEEARVVLEQAVARTPLDPVNHGYLADNLWNAGDSEEAFDRLRIALKLDPGYDWAWRAAQEIGPSMEAPDRALQHFTGRPLAAEIPYLAGARSHVAGPRTQRGSSWRLSTRRSNSTRAQLRARS